MDNCFFHSTLNNAKFAHAYLGYSKGFPFQKLGKQNKVGRFGQLLKVSNLTVFFRLQGAPDYKVQYQKLNASLTISIHQVHWTIRHINTKASGRFRGF